MTFTVLLPKSCDKCPYRRSVNRRCGATYHCVPEVSNMDVTHVPKGERSSFCPINRLYSWIARTKEDNSDE